MKYNNKDDKIWRLYEVIDIETGELLKIEQRKNYITVEITKTITINKYGQKIETTRRYVKHNGQTRLWY